jgi:3',5'-cyclic AMP phosphodiesterase CpdA
MNIVQLTDLHVRPPGVAAYRVAETNMLTERALRAVAALQPVPDAVIITGDLTDCGLDSEYGLLVDMLRRHLSVPVFVIPGNHDRREVLLRHFPATGQAAGFVQYAIEDFPVRLVMLDTVVPGAGHGELCGERLDWLDRTLAAEPDKPTLIGMHHPPFLCGIQHMDAIALQQPERFAAIISRHRQVSRIVCGHHHRPIFVAMGHAVASIAPSVAHQVELELRAGAPGRFVMEPPAYHLHRWAPGTGIVTHMGYVESFPGPFPFLRDPDYPGVPQAE